MAGPFPTGLLSLKSHAKVLIAPFGSFAWNETASGAGPLGSLIAVGVAEIERFNAEPVDLSPPPHPAVPYMFIVNLPEPPLTGSALCRRGQKDKIREMDEGTVPFAP